MNFEEKRIKVSAFEISLPAGSNSDILEAFRAANKKIAEMKKEYWHGVSICSGKNVNSVDLKEEDCLIGDAISLAVVRKKVQIDRSRLKARIQQKSIFFKKSNGVSRVPKKQRAMIAEEAMAEERMENSMETMKIVPFALSGNHVYLNSVSGGDMELMKGIFAAAFHVLPVQIEPKTKNEEENITLPWEFLTWLLWQNETEKREFLLAGDFFFTDADGKSPCKKMIGKGELVPDSSECQSALEGGKLLEKADFLCVVEEEKYAGAIVADPFGFASLELPETTGMDEEQTFGEKMELIDALIREIKRKFDAFEADFHTEEYQRRKRQWIENRRMKIQE